MSFSCCDSRAIRASELRSEWVTPIQAATLGQDSVSVFTWQPSHWAFECLPADVACALIGSLGAVYTGIVLANFTLALFALVAIESGSQSLGRAYGGFLALALLLDIVWFCLFTIEIRHSWNETQLGKFGAFSVKLMFCMQASGCGLRLISSFLWCQMYRLRAISEALSLQERAEFHGRNSMSSLRKLNDSVLGDDAESELLGGSIYDTAAFSSLFESFNLQSDLDVESNGQRSEDERPLQTPLLLR
uniref:Transmembrane protein n=1 Tax=Physcomitrium patens TaxID=3218 RepID=A0A7I4BV68_PHYPA|nr:uncharacterized protein LOC112281897 isoform X1 [Physcomitrium patens]|eukprot:XP_024374677.1 uncharacterized protein LOC112281897 isoform X1 [Physcomitrella patens]